jgi:hypothetical protein
VQRFRPAIDPALADQVCRRIHVHQPRALAVDEHDAALAIE